MELKNYYGTNVKIISVTGQVFFGRVNDYFDAEDNENGMESIVIDTSNGDAIEFTKAAIETIEILMDEGYDKEIADAIEHGKQLDKNE